MSRVVSQSDFKDSQSDFKEKAELRPGILLEAFWFANAAPWQQRAKLAPTSPRNRVSTDNLEAKNPENTQFHVSTEMLQALQGCNGVSRHCQPTGPAL